VPPFRLSSSSELKALSMPESHVALGHDTKDDRVVIMTLAGPALNALDQTMLDALSAAVDAARCKRPRCIVVRSAHESAFCAGASIAAMRSMRKSQALALARRGQRVLEELARLPCRGDARRAAGLVPGQKQAQAPDAFPRPQERETKCA